MSTGISMSFMILIGLGAAILGIIVVVVIAILAFTGGRRDGEDRK